MYKIETGISPADGMAMQAKRGSKPKYPWLDMDVGDSFWAPVTAPTLRAGAYQQSLRWGLEFRVRKEGNGARAFRVA